MNMKKVMFIVLIAILTVTSMVGISSAQQSASADADQVSWYAVDFGNNQIYNLDGWDENVAESYIRSSFGQEIQLWIDSDLQKDCNFERAFNRVASDKDVKLTIIEDDKEGEKRYLKCKFENKTEKEKVKEYLEYINKILSMEKNVESVIKLGLEIK